MFEIRNIMNPVESGLAINEVHKEPIMKTQLHTIEETMMDCEQW